MSCLQLAPSYAKNGHEIFLPLNKFSIELVDKFIIFFLNIIFPSDENCEMVGKSFLHIVYWYDFFFTQNFVLFSNWSVEVLSLTLCNKEDKVLFVCSFSIHQRGHILSWTWWFSRGVYNVYKSLSTSIIYHHFFNFTRSSSMLKKCNIPTTMFRLWSTGNS